MDHPRLIKRLGGPTKLGRDLEVGLATLHWVARGIPFRHMPAVVELARAEGIQVTIQELIAAKPPTTQRAA